MSNEKRLNSLEAAFEHSDALGTIKDVVSTIRTLQQQNKQLIEGIEAVANSMWEGSSLRISLLSLLQSIQDDPS